MIKVGILGAHDSRVPVAVEWLMRHPHVQLVAMCGKNCAGNMVDDAFPRLINRLHMPFVELTPHQLAERCDLVISFLPHGESLHACIEVLHHGCRVIDLSPDYRFRNPLTYETWYGEKHADPTRLGQVPYGIIELFESHFEGAPVVASPGSVALPAIMSLAPLYKEHLLTSDDVIIDSKLGISGLDCLPHPSSCYCDRTENTEAFAVGSHRQQPEIVDVVERLTNITPQVTLTPHLVPMERGILSTIYVVPQVSVSANQIRECLLSHYQGYPFVRIVSHLPSTRAVLRTNYIDIAVRESGSRIVIIAVTDNLIRGGVGTAIQAMNKMFHLSESVGI